MKINSARKLVIFLVVSLIVILQRAWILHIFGFVYTDSDQTIMWLAAKNFSQGKFFEPRFYGQNYNTMLEALFAVPFIKLGVPYFISLPIVTSILSLIPVFLISVITYIRNSKTTAIIILCIYLTLPMEYSMITSMSRGFVTGVSFASLTFLFLYKYNSRVSFFFVFFISVLAYSINANSILLTIPVGLIFFLKNYKNRKFYLFSISGFLAGLAIHLLINSFYINNPNYILHYYHLKFSFSLFVNGLKHLDKYFNYIVPIFWKHGWLILTGFFVLAIIFYKSKIYDISFVSFIIPFIIVGTLLVIKVHNGTNSIFFSYSRMYLSVPILLLLMFSFLNIKDKRWLPVFLVVSIVFIGIKVLNSKSTIEQNLNKYHVVTVLKTDLVYKKCSELAAISMENNIDLIVIVDHWFYDVYDYGCPACLKKFPKTLRPIYERRTWRLLEDENKVYTNILFVDLKTRLDKKFYFISCLNEKQGFYLLKNNKIPTMLLLKKLGIKVRKF